MNHESTAEELAWLLAANQSEDKKIEVRDQRSVAGRAGGYKDSKELVAPKLCQISLRCAFQVQPGQ
jgi:hypothetical protein